MSDICRLHTADCTLQTTNCRPQITDGRQQITDRRIEKTLTYRWSQILKTTGLSPTQILDHVKESVCVDSEINPHVYSKMTKEGILRYNYEPFSLQ